MQLTLVVWSTWVAKSMPLTSQYGKQDGIMKRVLSAKFTQDDDINKVLLDTGTRTIGEANAKGILLSNRILTGVTTCSGQGQVGHRRKQTWYSVDGHSTWTIAIKLSFIDIVYTCIMVMYYMWMYSYCSHNAKQQIDLDILLFKT